MRAETGPIRFGEDWTGVFIRGDNAFAYWIALRAVLAATPDATADTRVAKMQLESLVRILAASNEQTPSPGLAVQQLRPWAECQPPDRPSGREVL